jgi:hypothetical protein
LISFPPGTEMFQFPGLPPHRLWIRQVGLQTSLWRGCPIRTSPDQSLLTAPRSFSQPATSFVGSSVPRHPPRALPSSAPRSLDPRQAGRINLLVLPSASSALCCPQLRAVPCLCSTTLRLSMCLARSPGDLPSRLERRALERRRQVLGQKKRPDIRRAEDRRERDRWDAFMRLALPQRRWACAPWLGCGQRAGLAPRD